MPYEDPGACVPQQAVSPVDLGEIIINKAANGFIVRVGCKVLVFKSWQELREALGLYLKNPTAARKKYCSDELKGKRNDLSRNRPRKSRRRRKNSQ
jgi:hypothetical protein